MEPRPSGWYDDPDEPTRLRYWNGQGWTDRYADKAPMPAAAPSRRPDPWAAHRPDRDAAASDDARPASPEEDGQVGPSPAPAGQDRPGTPGPGGPTPGWSQAPPPPRAGADAYPPHAPTPGPYAGPPRVGPRQLAADGVPLAGFGRRVLAHLVDYVIVVVLVSLVTAPFLGGSIEAFQAWFRNAQAAAQSGATLPVIPPELLTVSSIVSLLQAAAFVGYEVALLPRRGSTPGRRLAGIRVRPLGEARPPEQAAVVRRSLVKYVAQILSPVPLIGQLAFFFLVVDWLWPLRDPGRQALHDKVATTEVVRAT